MRLGMVLIVEDAGDMLMDTNLDRVSDLATVDNA